MTAVLPTQVAAQRLKDLPRCLENETGFAGAVAALARGEPASFDGAWGSACALLAAELGRRAPGPLLIVAPTEDAAEDIAADLTAFINAAASSIELFPAWETAPEERAVRDEVYGQRLRVLKGAKDLRQADRLRSEPSEKTSVREKTSSPKPAGLGRFVKKLKGEEEAAPAVEEDGPATTAPLLVTSIAALLQPVPEPAALAAATRQLARGQRVHLEELLEWLVTRGFHATSAVELPGEFSHRGGILDIFAPDWLQPVRLEFFDDEIESLRRFDIASQRSLETLDRIEITVLAPREVQSGHLADYLPAGTWVLLVEPDQVREEGINYLRRIGKPDQHHSVEGVFGRWQKFSVASAAGLLLSSAETVCRLGIESIERFSGDISHVREELDRIGGENQVYVVTQTEAEIERLREILGTTVIASRGQLHYPLGSLKQGFRLRNAGVVVVTGSELFHRGELRRPPRRRLGKAIDSFLDLREGDLVVHLAHGIGRYRGLKLIDKQGNAEEHLEIEFDGGTKIFVPAIKIDLVQKYIGGSQSRPTLAKIGGKSWLKQKQSAESAVMDLAAEMLELQAMRSARPGIAFQADSDWQREFDSSFPYHETPDQLTAIEAIKGDMLRPRPMDRLLCGDVGFGKTEVAMRAAFKAVDSGYQVAVMVPTTILAEQHFHTFCERMAEFPVTIGKLSRFCMPQQQRETLEGLKTGKVDIAIGTHRVASLDVQFKNLGLVVIDEEQRFGVDVKERLKQFRSMVDVLTLSATPIPRTLHMSLVGVRDISNLETAPEERIAVETRVTRWNDELIKHAIERELARGGQIYFVHNRVQDIEEISAKLHDLVPDLTIGIGHGQMPEGELEDVMVGFVNHKFDCLVATTIVESGLDIPNANTIFIDEADRYGLADLHQLRGRVGRYKHRAYCYMLTQPHKHLTPNAARRLRAIEEFSEMGAGFAIAMRDLEIRGAGNLLGTQQSGHINAVGYELYCTLLENAVRTLQKLPPRLNLEVDVNLPGEAYLPADYIDDMRLKIDLYRRLTRITQYGDLDDFRAELTDRFGPIPEQTERLLRLAELKMDAVVWQVSAIYIEKKFVVFKYLNRQRIEQLSRQHKGKLRVVDNESAYWPIAGDETDGDYLLQVLKAVLKPAAIK